MHSLHVTERPAMDDWLLPLLREMASESAVHSLAPGTGSYWSKAVAAGLTTDEGIVTALAARARIHIAATLASSDQACAQVPERIARRYGVLPLSVSDTTLEVATGNPYDLDCEQTLAFVAGRKVRMSLASPMRIAERLDEVYRPTNVIERLLASTASAASVRVEEMAVEDNAVNERDLADSARDRPIIKLVDHIVGEGVALGASDIHLESEEGLIAVRYRIDGVLRKALVLPKAVGLPLVSRVKIMARMDIADRLRPQGGRAVVTVDGVRIDLRVSTLPAANGEKVVIRILDSRGSVRSLDSLGMDGSDAAQLHRLLEIREGLLLVTGPTGSGKTTTLYAALQRLLDRGLNIITVEDPVEYRIAGIVQVQVNEKAGLTFAAALRSILRQDPDVILVGEIRDRETAAIAIQAALTGHLVFATLHTIDAASSIARMHDLGVEPVKVAAALKGVIAQRLLRRTCGECAVTSDDPVPALLWSAIPSGARLLKGKGCTSCAGSGYKGRIAVIELLTLTPTLTRLVAAAEPVGKLCEAARESGSRSLWGSGVARVLSGDTTAEEIARVLEPDHMGHDSTGNEPCDNACEEFGSHGGAPSYDTYFSDDEADEHRSKLGAPTPFSRDPMTTVKVGVVDVYVIDPHTKPWKALALQRGGHTRCPGSWEAVHGHLEEGEAPEVAAVRELSEETGLDIERLYNVTVHAFYLHEIATVELAVVFCAFVDSSVPVKLGQEHQAYEWLPLDQAADRYIWPRGTQALQEITKLLGHGDAGAAEDVLRVR